MKIDSLHIKNYRTLQDVKVQFSGYYTAISGQNNAGKTSLIKIIREIIKDNTEHMFFYSENKGIDYREDKTQWVKDNPNIDVTYTLSITQNSDPGLFKFLEKFSGDEIDKNKVKININIITKQKNDVECVVSLEENILGEYESNEILKRIQTSSLGLFHNSTGADINTIMGNRGRIFHEFAFSDDELEQLQNEQRRLTNKVKKLAKVHKAELAELLGHLKDKYDVEYTIPENYFSKSMPFGINLKDKDLEIPLSEWGSGTRNRTQIMMSILQANRVKKQIEDSNRITPIVIIEEPESFLHPSAQAEFGRVLRNLASELKIQTIITTHSPYMLSQDNPGSNILLDRKVFRGRLKETIPVEVEEDTWMEPFSKILGLNNSEFQPWKNVLSTEKNDVLLVEGDIDKKYLEHLNSLNNNNLNLPKNIEIVAYGGKDALKNTIMLKFMFDKFDKIYITFDLDAKNELSKYMQRLEMKEYNDFLAIGKDSPGYDCIEGLVPESIRSKVYGSNPKLIAKLTSQNTKDRKSAKNEIKAKILSEFCSNIKYTKKELNDFVLLFKQITKAFKQI